MRWHRGWPAVDRLCSRCRGTKAAIGGNAAVNPGSPKTPVCGRFAPDRSLRQRLQRQPPVTDDVFHDQRRYQPLDVGQ